MAGGLAGGSVAEAALEAWVECQPDGYVMAAGRMPKLLPRIEAKIHKRSISSDEFGKSIFSSSGSEPAIFLQMLRPQEGKVHFLYFWKAFGEAVRIAGATPPDTENLAAELDMVRDRVLRLAEEAAAAVKTGGYAGGSSSSSGPKHQQAFPTLAFVDEVHRAASMSAYPQFWQAAANSLSSQMENDSLSLEAVTSVLLSWLKDSAMWEQTLSAAKAPVAKEEAKGLQVLLHVYDVSQEESIQKINRVLAHKSSFLKLGGVFHAGVEVNGLEWAYGFSASETHPGVGCMEPKSHPQHHYRQTVSMGFTVVPPEDIADIMTHLLEEYPGDDYDLLRRNCCHFADDFTRRLGVGSIPGWVIRLARIGASVDTLLQSAPRPIKERIYGKEEDDSD